MMNTRKTGIGAMGLLLLGLGLGQAQEAQTMDQKMMEAYMKIMQVNENHSFLKKIEGAWEAETKAWMQPGAEPVKADNRAQAEMILGGRFLKVDIKGTMFGQPFEGLQIIGYDNHKKKIVSFWIDSTSTAFYMTEGELDSEAGRITETGLWPDPMTGGDMKVRMVTTLVSRDEYTLEMFMTGPDGSEFKSMETRSTRRK